MKLHIPYYHKLTDQQCGAAQYGSEVHSCRINKVPCDSIFEFITITTPIIN